MNELQKVEFDIFLEFIKVCKQLNLRYYVLCGTALGAAKYKSFIPWDDDLDVGLYRPDYEVFCSKAQNLLPKHYFIQTYKTDDKYPNVYCKIRDSRTTYIEKSVKELPINHGVYIDVFPLDGYPQNKCKQIIFEIRKYFYKLQLACVFNSEESLSSKTRLLFKFERFLGFHKRTNKILQKYERMISSYSTDETKLICNHGNWQGRLEYVPKEQYGNGLLCEFENIEVNIPEKYNEYLKQKYGDWKKELPKEQQIGHHYYFAMDLDVSYKEYIK